MKDQPLEQRTEQTSGKSSVGFKIAEYKQQMEKYWDESSYHRRNWATIYFLGGIAGGAALVERAYSLISETHFLVAITSSLMLGMWGAYSSIKKDYHARIDAWATQGKIDELEGRPNSFHEDMKKIMGCGGDCSHCNKD